MVLDGQVRAFECFCFGIVIMVGRITAGRITSTGMLTVMHAPVNRVSMLPDLKKENNVILRPALTAE